jgi:hypothetical protein
MGYACRRTGQHDGRPVGVECVDEFVSGLDEVLSDPALGDEVHYGKKQKRLVGCAMVGYRRIPIPAPVGPKLCEHLEVFVKHCCGPTLDSYAGSKSSECLRSVCKLFSERAHQSTASFCRSSRTRQIEKVIKS